MQGNQIKTIQAKFALQIYLVLKQGKLVQKLVHELKETIGKSKQTVHFKDSSLRCLLPISLFGKKIQPLHAIGKHLSLSN